MKYVATVTPEILQFLLERGCVTHYDDVKHITLPHTFIQEGDSLQLEETIPEYVPYAPIETLLLKYQRILGNIEQNIRVLEKQEQDTYTISKITHYKTATIPYKEFIGDLEQLNSKL